MTIRSRLFGFCLVLQYCSFFGLIAFGIYQSDAFDSRLLFPITLMGVACGINTWALLERSGGTREDDSPRLPIPLRKGTATRDTRDDG